MAVHYFLVCPVLPLLTLVSVEALQYGRRGSETTLLPQIRGPPDAIVWKQASRKVVEFDGSEESVHGTFQDRVVLDWHTASLTIKDLREADSGPYELEATINNKKYYSEHEVAVIDKVAVPTISCLINGTVSGVGMADPVRLRGVLGCSAEGPPSLITYDWTTPDGMTVRGAGLTVALAGDQDDTVYTCRATNPVSQETGTFVARDCYPDSFSSGWIIAIVVLCLLLVLSAGCILGYWRWSKAPPKDDGIEDMEKQPLNRSNGSGNTKAFDKDNRATLPSSQRLSLLSPHYPAIDPGVLEEDHTAHSGGGENSTRVSVHSSESRLPEPQQPSDLESELSAGDSLVAPGVDSESHLPPTASPEGSALLPVAAETEASQTRPHRLSASSLEDLQRSSLETSDPPTKACPSPGLPDNQSDSDITSPQHITPRDGHLSSDEDGQAAQADIYGSDPEAPEPAAVILGVKEPWCSLGCPPEEKEKEKEEKEEEEGDVAALDPMSVLGSSSEEEEREKEEKLEVATAVPQSLLASSKAEQEEKRKDTEPACVSPGEERSREHLVAAGVPSVILETLPSEIKEAGSDAEAPHKAEVQQEEDDDDDDDDEEGGLEVSSPDQAPRPESHSDSEAAEEERGTERREENTEETSHTPEVKHQDPGDVARQVASPTEPNSTVMARREEEEANIVPGTSREEEEDAKDGGGASFPASTHETQGDTEALTGEGKTDGRVKEETLERKEEEHHVPQTVEEGGKEGEKTGLTEMGSPPRTGPDPDREPGESGAGRGETPGSGGQREEEATANGKLSANQGIGEDERRDGNKEAENEE